MTDIGIDEAQTHFPELADRVAKGESFTLMREGEPIGELTPVKPAQEKRISPEEVERIIEEVRAIRARCKPVTVEEILEWKAEGRR